MAVTWNCGLFFTIPLFLSHSFKECENCHASNSRILSATNPENVHSWKNWDISKFWGDLDTSSPGVFFLSGAAFGYEFRAPGVREKQIHGDGAVLSTSEMQVRTPLIDSGEKEARMWVRLMYRCCEVYLGFFQGLACQQVKIY